jgi:hypothetical protein
MEDPNMTRKNGNETSERRTVKALANDELAKVIGGTGTPEQPIGDPGESGDLYGDLAWEAIGIKPTR